VGHVENYRKQLSAAIDALDSEAINAWIDRLARARSEGATIFVAGNGGSAATASHFATDLGKGASYGKPERFRVVALTDSIPTITAYANDVSYDVVFAEQLRNLGKPGDVLVTISGSGSSPSIVAVIQAAKELGMDVVALTGFQGGASGPMADIHINVTSDHMGRIEDVHMALCHTAAFYFMDRDEHTQH
jgi:D-sedoheptulose 7-phosphate isomerase